MNRCLHAVLSVSVLLAARAGVAESQVAATQPALFRITVDGKIGYMDSAGNTVIKPQFDSASDFTEGLACFIIDHKFGYIGPSGKIAIPAIRLGFPFHEGLAIAAEGRMLRIY